MSYDVTTTKMEKLLAGFAFQPQWAPGVKPGHVVLWRDGTFRKVTAAGKSDKVYAFAFEGQDKLDFVDEKEKILVVTEKDA